MKILIDLYMDGYETQEEADEACLEYVVDQLDSSGTGITILWHENMNKTIESAMEEETGQ